MRLSRGSMSGEAGFSLVELAIVIVIIGLIVSSVLVGQDLVKSAEMRSLVSDYNKFNQATATFRDRFMGMPGDARALTKFSFGTADGNEDTVLQDSAGGNDKHDGEFVLYWHHLTSAGLLDIPRCCDGTAISVGNTTDLAAKLPQAKSGGYWGTYSGDAAPSGQQTANNYFIYGATYNGTDDDWATAAAIDPQGLYNVDQKIDDGRPGRGALEARGANGTDPLTAPTAGTAATDCVSAATVDGTYNASNKAAVCTFSIKMRI